MSFSYTSSSAPFARKYPLVAVLKRRYDGEAVEGFPPYVFLPNVECLQIEEFEGDRPAAASFRYKFGDPLRDDDDPQRIEDVFPLDASGPRVVEGGDRIVVRQYRADGSYRHLFDGYALLPQAEADKTKELGSFTALGRPIRFWDYAVGGALMRNADDPDTADDTSDVLCKGIQTRFNPSMEEREGPQPNRVPDEGFVNEGEDNAYPIFLDWRLRPDPKAPDSDKRKFWSLSDAVCYLLFYSRLNNPDDPDNPPEDFLTCPTADEIKALLDSRVPSPDPDGVIDPDDSSTYEDKPIDVTDIDITGDAWPEALAKIITPHGFGFSWRLSTDDGGEPAWSIEFYRLDTPKPVKRLYMPKAGPGAVYNPARTNLHGLSLQRDVRDLVNQFVIDSARRLYEVSFILVPGFQISTTDDQAPTANHWIKGQADFDPIKYRRFVFDECGEGHSEFSGASSYIWVPNTPTSFDDVFGKPDTDNNTGKQIPRYVKRRRPGIATLLTRDDFGDPRQAELRVSTDYTLANAPEVWDGSGTWHRVTAGGWRLADDRLGIELTMPNPNEWNIGQDLATANAPFPDGKLPVVTCLCNPDNAVTFRFVFMLTCVIEGDFGLDVLAKFRPASPIRRHITRRIEGRDRWARQTVIASSWFGDSENGDEDIRDDTEDAKAIAYAYRKAHELGKTAGTLSFQRITSALRVGDRVDAIDGRGISLTENAGEAAGEGATYPVVVGRTWIVGGDGGPATILSLADRRMDPPQEHRR